jgi:hypothetical protein
MISSHTGFQPLKTVWLGNTYPERFYDHLDSESQDALMKLTELTHHDLNQIEKKLIELNVQVQRPQFQSIDSFISNDKLIKPPICPRDWAMVLGDTLYITPQYESGIEPWQWAIDQYIDQQQNVIVLNRFSEISDPMCWVTFPSFVRAGKDLFIDYSLKDENSAKNNQIICEQLSKDYRVHVSHTGDHSDGIFCPVRAGQIFSTHYRQIYSDTFPDWDVFFLTDTTINRKYKGNGYNGTWWQKDFYLPYYNSSLISNVNSWLGNSEETVFEVNMLVVDEKNVICIAEDDAACRKLEELGITPHVVDFKTRSFWDGGIHCITLDIHRQGECVDFWPDRGPNGIYYY